jgi:hypothetical protein
MDAYDLADSLKSMWAQHFDKASGSLPKPENKIRVVVNTDDGLREVVGLHWNRETNNIELVLDNE